MPSPAAPRRRTLLVAALATFLVACSDATSPEERVAGSYEMTVLSVPTPAGPVDALALGAAMMLVLRPDGTTAGYFVSAEVEDASSPLWAQAVSVDLAGTWTLTSGRVRLTPTAAPFLRDFELTVDGERLVHDAGGVRLELLRR